MNMVRYIGTHVVSNKRSIAGHMNDMFKKIYAIQILLSRAFVHTLIQVEQTWIDILSIHTIKNKQVIWFSLGNLNTNVTGARPVAKCSNGNVYTCMDRSFLDNFQLCVEIRNICWTKVVEAFLATSSACILRKCSSCQNRDVTPFLDVGIDVVMVMADCGERQFADLKWICFNCSDSN